MILQDITQKTVESGNIAKDDVLGTFAKNKIRQRNRMSLPTKNMRQADLQKKYKARRSVPVFARVNLEEEVQQDEEMSVEEKFKFDPKLKAVLLVLLIVAMFVFQPDMS